MIIALMGMPSAGKTYLARKIAKHYGLKHYSMGDIRRKAAQAKGMTLTDYNKYGETHDTDTMVEEFQKTLGRTDDDFVADGRMSAWAIPHSIKVYVDANEEVRAKRMITPDPEHKRIGEQPQTVEEAKKLLHERVRSDKARYIRHYDYDPYERSHYDIILDTTDLNKEEALAELIKIIDKRNI